MNHFKKIIKYIVYLKFITSSYNFFKLKTNRVRIPKKLVINGKIYLSNKGSIVFGDNLRINSGKNYNVIGGDIRTNMIVLKNGVLSIGDNVGLSNSTFFCTENITIEDDVLIGGNCKFYDTDFHSLDYDIRLNPYKNNIPDNGVNTAPIRIEKGAWIGGHCIILKGVTVGSKSIIGAGSVVSKSIPNNEIWAGNPAKFIRKVDE